MKKITKREVVAFVFGIMAVFVLDIIVNWDDSVKAFNEGYDSVRIQTNK
ncbi:hypothetical protein [Lacihabitans sp. LS3-19]|nr:hypothetical protein [Lacihabitans sp. LS3-19]